MRISRAEKEKLREKILTEALPFLKKSGSGGAPVDQIMKQAGLTSGALYSHFKSKEDFFVQVVLRELDSLLVHYENEVREYGTKAIGRLIDTYLSEEHVRAVGEGCIFTALGADMQRQKPSVRALYEEKTQAIFAAIGKALPTGTPAERTNQAQFIFSSLVGTLVFARSTRNPDLTRQMLAAARRQLRTFI